jgi:hypothetical protein
MNRAGFQRPSSHGRPAALAGQATVEALLIVCLVVMALVMLPDNAVERVLIAIEGRHQAILKYVGTP